MNIWGSVASLSLLVLALGGCASAPKESSPPSDPVDQMLISFNGSPSKQQLKEALDNAFAATDTAATNDNYSRAGSVLVAYREKHGIDEMKILDCVPTRAHDPRVKDNTFASIAAVCLTDLVTGK
jgi:hypothetical protein